MDLSKYTTLTHLADFEELDDLIIIEDVETQQIVLRNKAYRDEVEELNGALPTFDKRFITIDSIVSTIEGRPCVIEVAKKVLPVTQSTYNKDLRLVVSDIENIVRTETSIDFLLSEDGKRHHDTLIDKIVRKVMGFYECPYAQLFLFRGEVTEKGHLFQYKLGEEGDPTHSLTVLNGYWINSLGNFFNIGYSLLCEDINGFAAFDINLASMFQSMGIHSIVIIPFFFEGKLMGFLNLANPKKEGDSLDLFLADFGANSIGSMVYRGLLYEGLYFDKVTGFPWLNAIEYYYPTYLKDHSDVPVVIFQFDFLQFRMVTRTYGNEKGNEILAKVAAILRQKYPASLIARRNGSDQFVVVTTGIAENVAIEANRIIEEVQSYYPSILMTMVFGIYQVKDMEENVEYALLKATFAHRAGKGDPFNRVKIFDEQMGKKEALSLFYSNHFRESIEKGEFEVYIQPKYNLETSSYYGGEALVRWRLDGKLIPPGEFIPLFESNGICRELDLYVLKETCKTVAKWLKKSPQMAVPISVNFSRVDFADTTLFERILYIVKESGVPTQYIEVEITESAYVDYEAQIIPFLKKCRAAGIRVLMDDFGSGVSSFNSLKDLEIDVLKLDYKFLSATGDNAKKRKIIEGIVALARSIHIPVIVEGIETNEEAAFFRSLGVRFVQGYLFGKPMPVEEFEKIRNKSTIIDQEEVNDSRMLFNELLDSSSNANLLFSDLDLMLGVFRFDGEGLYPVALNRKLEHGVSSLVPVIKFLDGDVLNYVSSDARFKILNCLKEEKPTYSFGPTKRVTFHFGVSDVTIVLSSMYVKEEAGNWYYLIQGNVDASSSNLPETHSNDLERMLSSPIQGCVLVDSAGFIVDFNRVMFENFPSIEIGMHADEVFGKEIRWAATLQRIYNFNSKNVFEVESRRGVYQGKEVYALVFSNLGSPNRHISELGGTGFRFYDRMLSTLSKVAVSYVEVNLDEDYFMEVRLDETVGAEYGDIASFGSYSQALFKRFLEAVQRADLNKVKEKMAYNKLIEASKSMSPFSLTYKLRGKNVFHRVDVKFYFDRGHRYACFFLEDVTEAQSINFDALTGCMGRSAGIRIINSHINEHPLDKMALIIMDIDGFKQLNDTYGHSLGDKILAEVHGTFKKLPPVYRFSTRLGGDEFCVLLTYRDEGFDPDKIRAELDEAFRNIGFKAGINQEVHVSCGIAKLPECGISFEVAYPFADGDLYEQKHIRKSKVN